MSAEILPQGKQNGLLPLYYIAEATVLICLADDVRIAILILMILLIGGVFEITVLFHHKLEIYVQLMVRIIQA
jgi:hypothetical protein